MKLLTTLNILPADNTVIIVPDTQVPLAGVFDSGVWALIDLILACFSLITFLMLVAVMLFRYYRRGRIVLYFISRAMPWMLFAALAAMLVVFLFAFSQDFNGIMRLYDRWSLVLLCLYLVQILLTVLALVRSTQNNGLKDFADFDIDSAGRLSEMFEMSDMFEMSLSGKPSQPSQPSQPSRPSRHGKRRLKLWSGASGQLEEDTKTDTKKHRL
jgi:magnesium-transporting ATPase (P-type)